ncbi:T9SS type A sorting domain-containing protein, partial [candidate division KSB1 bacterium]|nr:T9SS type A sorting domain-containing protein [candidate division KSB1 bacterium]
TRPSDSVVIELSSDEGETWTSIAPAYSGIKIKSAVDRYLDEEISLDGWTGAGFDRVLLRLVYRLADGLPAANNGFYIDDVRILLSATSVETAPVSAMPERYVLAQNYPNPFNLETVLDFDLPQNGHTRLQIHNIRGQLVSTLIDDQRAAGSYRLVWDGRDALGRVLPTGVYLYTLQSGEFQMTRKLLLLK